MGYTGPLNPAGGRHSGSLVTLPSVFPASGHQRAEVVATCAEQAMV